MSSDALVPADEAEIAELLRVASFLRLRASPNPETGKSYTIQEALQALGLGSYNTVVRWREQGLVKKGARLLLGEMALDFQAAAAGVWQRWAEIVERQVRTAMGDDPKAALAAARWLQEMFIGPALAVSPDPGAEELAYLEAGASSDPFLPLKGDITIRVRVGEEPRRVPGRVVEDD